MRLKPSSAFTLVSLGSFLLVCFSFFYTDAADRFSKDLYLVLIVSSNHTSLFIKEKQSGGRGEKLHRKSLSDYICNYYAPVMNSLYYAQFEEIMI